MSTTNKETTIKSSADLSAEALYARLYHHALPEWKGEFAFYRRLAQEMKNVGSILEVACGTGRIAIGLAQHGSQVTGFDLSPEMLEVARETSAGMKNLRWEIADMRSFDMGERYGLVVSPGHSFQFMLTPADQLACLASIKRHLFPGGRLLIHIDHQDLTWLGNLVGEYGGKFKLAGTLPHPVNGNPLNVFRKWYYQPSTQTAFSSTRWEERDAQGNMVQCWERGPVALHCLFRYEMEHLLYRAGFHVLALYGNFAYQSLQEDSPEMIWVSEHKENV